MEPDVPVDNPRTLYTDSAKTPSCDPRRQYYWMPVKEGPTFVHARKGFRIHRVRSSRIYPNRHPSSGPEYSTTFWCGNLTGFPVVYNPKGEHNQYLEMCFTCERAYQRHKRVAAEGYYTHKRRYTN